MWRPWRTKTLDACNPAGALNGTDRLAIAQGVSSEILRTTLSAIATKVGAILGALTPSFGTDLVNKAYVDALFLNVSQRLQVRAASTVNINLASPGATIDGVAMVAGQKFLAKDQTTAADKGPYVWNGAAVAATRAVEFDTYDEIAGALIIVEEGGTNADTMWLCTSNKGGTLGTTAISYLRIRIELSDPVTLAQGGLGADVSGFSGVLEISGGSIVARVRDTDALMAANSDTRFPSQKAVRTAIGYPVVLLGAAKAVNFNLVADTAIAITLPFGAANWRLAAIVICDATGDLSASHFALFTATGGGGTGIRGDTACNITNGTPNTASNLQAVGPSVDALYNVATVQFRMMTAQGAARTADVYLFGYPLPALP
ncbi:MAG: hypothetical protein E6G97_07445 [Alphaproteobacteria bacterium]|nr:MAG: hypothetical protein E6G97_07445 [Alphaproteobacteria bacterium]